jgi:hypothetical protein
MNWNESMELTDEERNRYSFYEAVNCTEDNFQIGVERDPKYSAKELFAEWEGYSLLCPKLTDDIVLKGSE